MDTIIYNYRDTIILFSFCLSRATTNERLTVHCVVENFTINGKPHWQFQSVTSLGRWNLDTRRRCPLAAAWPWRNCGTRIGAAKPPTGPACPGRTWWPRARGAKPPTGTAGPRARGAKPPTGTAEPRAGEGKAPTRPAWPWLTCEARTEGANAATGAGWPRTMLAAAAAGAAWFDGYGWWRTDWDEETLEEEGWRKNPCWGTLTEAGWDGISPSLARSSSSKSELFAGSSFAVSNPLALISLRRSKGEKPKSAHAPNLSWWFRNLPMSMLLDKNSENKIK